MDAIKDQKGVVALITVIIIALFLFSAGILLGVQGNTSLFTGQFASQSDKAEALAQAGIQDALVRLGRNGLNGNDANYVLTETDGTVTVSITNVLGGAQVNSDAIVKVGTETVDRSIFAQVTIDADGKITSVTQNDQ